MKKKKYEIERDLRYLTLLAQSFPTVAEACLLYTSDAADEL